MNDDELKRAYEAQTGGGDTWFKALLIGFALIAAYSVMTAEPTNGPLHGDPDNGMCWAESGPYEC